MSGDGYDFMGFVILIFLIVCLCVLFGGDPDLHDVLLEQLRCDSWR